MGHQETFQEFGLGFPDLDHFLSGRGGEGIERIIPVANHKNCNVKLKSKLEPIAVKWERNVRF